MTILEIQEYCIQQGLQWQENVFNDGNAHNCMINFTWSKDPHYLSQHPCGDFGWGRFTREWAWQQAYECISSGKAKQFQPRKD